MFFEDELVENRNKLGEVYLWIRHVIQLYRLVSLSDVFDVVGNCALVVGGVAIPPDLVAMRRLISISSAFCSTLVSFELVIARFLSTVHLLFHLGGDFG